MIQPWAAEPGGTGGMCPHKFYELLIGVQLFTIEICLAT